MAARSVQQEVLAVREFELAGDQHLEIDLATGRLQGRVVDVADGTPLEDAEVVLEPTREPASGSTATSTTDSRGFFRFARLAAGSYRLRVRHQSYAPLERRIEIATGESPAGLELGLERTSGLVLRVRDAAGRAPDVVLAAALAPPAEEPVVAGRFLAGAEGSVRLAGLPDGRWTLLVRSPSSGTVRLSVSAPGDPLPVLLPPLTRLEITVPALVDGGDVGTATVYGAEGAFVAVGSGGTRRQWPVRGGWTVVDSLPPGAWSVTVTAADGRSWTARVVTSAGGGVVRLVVE